MTFLDRIGIVLAKRNTQRLFPFLIEKIGFRLCIDFNFLEINKLYHRSVNIIIFSISVICESSILNPVLQ